MRSLLLFVFWITLSSILPAQETLTGKIVGVHDGDSVTLLVNRTQHKIRLIDIDAPELGQDFGTKSKQALSKQIHGKTVIVKSKGKDQYGRTLGTIYAANRNINWWMVEHGWAWQYTKYNTNPKLAALLAKAKSSKIGIWSVNGSIPPWEYRALKKKQRSVNTVRKRGVDASLTYWLNSSSNARHNSTCKWYRNTKRGRICSDNEGKACGICGG